MRFKAHRWRAEARPLRGKGKKKIRDWCPESRSSLAVAGTSFRHPGPQRRRKKSPGNPGNSNFFGAEKVLVKGELAARLGLGK